MRVKRPKGTVEAHQLICYGPGEAAGVHRAVTAGQLIWKTFKDTLSFLSITMKEDSLHTEKRWWETLSCGTALQGRALGGHIQTSLKQ